MTWIYMFCGQTANFATNLPLTGPKNVNPHSLKTEIPLIYKGFFGRGERIRTSGLCVPNAALYQAEPHPAFLHYGRWRGGFQAAASRSISFPAGPF